jgi:hypothetical protein
VKTFQGRWSGVKQTAKDRVHPTSRQEIIGQEIPHRMALVLYHIAGLKYVSKRESRRHNRLIMMPEMVEDNEASF